MAAQAERKFKKVTGETSLRFIRPSQLAEDGITGEILEGVYLGSVPNQLDPEKNDYKFETETETVIVNSTGSLAYKMKSIPVGSLVRLNYLGKEPIKNGRMAGKPAHNFEVLVAEEA